MTKVEAPPREATSVSNRLTRLHTPETFAKWRTEEPELIENWQRRGCEKSLSTLLSRYKGFLRSQVRRIVQGRSLSEGHYPDLIQEAHLAFIKAVSNFDTSMGTQLSTHALIYVRNALLTYSLDYRHSYRIGTGSDERKAFYAALSLRSQRIDAGESDVLTDADITDIQNRTGASAQSTKRAVNSLYARQTDIADETDNLSGDDADTQIENLSIERAMKTLAPFIAELGERERVIFDNCLSDDGAATQDIADRFEITPERIGQIRRALFTDMAIFLKRNGITADDLF